jgi:hypothetical protein
MVSPAGQERRSIMSVSEYYIKFKTIKDIDLDIIETAILFGVDGQFAPPEI